ncbi:ATP-grasp domain-containing protein [Legionella lytica]|uniref:ATP-grasp domain-containing protein n=1 Tax=Legionella lytica TaxID=96232 RepID=A0ABY4Y4X9_9GAMM|nr:ATP-grasp domain-containing protein [Legionella lytica]USQ12527.1 ATP-grasp domain-containing protein [Legionella lytica]
MRILLTGAGGAAAVSVWKSLNQEHDIFMADIDPCAAGLYLVPPARRLIIPPGNSPKFSSILLQECQKHQIELFIPTVDCELAHLALQAKQFAEHGIKMPLSSVESLERCRDKYSLLTYCQSTGHTPTFSLFTPALDVALLQFPCFAKPRCGAGSNGAMIINGVEELKMLPDDGSYLIQELLPGDEYSVDVYIHSTGIPIAAVPRLRMKIDSGIAVAAQTCINPQLSRMAIDIATRAGITYVANVQFKADAKGAFKLLEINPRFPGTLPLTAAAGIDIPQLLIDDLLNKPFTSDLLPFKELMVVRYWTEHFFAPDEWKALCSSQTPD